MYEHEAENIRNVQSSSSDDSESSGESNKSKKSGILENEGKGEVEIVEGEVASPTIHPEPINSKSKSSGLALASRQSSIRGGPTPQNGGTTRDILSIGRQNPS